MADRKDGNDDAECMWEAARGATAGPASALGIVRNASEDDFSDLEVSPDFKPIKPASKVERDEYEVAMTGPAAFMDPAPTKPDVNPAQNNPLAGLVSEVEVASVGTVGVAAPESKRSKLPIYAALAASVVGLAFLGAKSWPSATASETPLEIAPEYAAVSPQQTGVDKGASIPISAGLFDEPLAEPLAEPSVSQTAMTTTEQVVERVEETLSEPSVAEEPTVLAMVEPSVTPDPIAPPVIDEPAKIEPAKIELVEVEPLLDQPMPEDLETETSELPAPVTEVSSSSGIGIGLTRSDCATRFRTVSDSGSIRFELGSATLRQSSERVLNSFASVFELCSKFKISVAGHTDDTGDASYNQALSEKRATSVAKFLVKLGVAKDALTVAGYGESKPIVSNDTKQNRARNRRIEFLVHDG